MNKLWLFSAATLRDRIERARCAVEFLHATRENGYMSFRQPALGVGDRYGACFRRPQTGAAADGQMGCVKKTYRDW
jgi:hypothetical protein